MTTRARVACGLLALALWALAFDAAGRDVWTAPWPGVRHLHRYGTGVDVHAVLVDLRDPAVSVVATRPADRFITVGTFARRYGAQVAINANFYRHDSCGLAVGDGEVFDHAYEDGCGASLGFGRENEAAPFDSTAVPRGPAPEAWMTEVLTGKPWLLRDGVAAMNWVRPQHLYRPNPRTVAGLSRDRATLVLLTADGRRPGVPGLTGFELVRLLRELGCWDAINLDGGGSTTLVMGRRVINRPSDQGRLRSVVTHLGVRVRPGARWFAGEVVGRHAAAEAAEDDEVPVAVEVRNTGRSTWRAGEASSPRLVLDDGEQRAEAFVSAPTAPGAVGRFALRWRARGVGARTLRARLVAPDGGAMGAAPVALAVAVRRPGPVAPAQAAARAVARATEGGVAPGVALVVGCLAALARTGRRRRKTMRKSLLALGVALAVGPSAVARDVVTYPYRCVEHVHRTVPGLDAHVVTVDLTCGEIDVVATRPRDRGATVSTFAREYGAQVAINTNFFGGGRSCGLAVGDREVWRDSFQERPSPCAASFAFGPTASGTRAMLFDSADSLRANPFPWSTNVVTGKPVLLRAGAAVLAPDDPIGMYRTHPRTAIGATPGGATLVIAVIDGRWPGLPGVTSSEMIPLLEEFGVADAINLDGGGSSQLWIASEGGIVNRPSDRHERSVVTHLGIRVTSALGAPMP